MNLHNSYRVKMVIKKPLYGRSHASWQLCGGNGAAIAQSKRYTALTQCRKMAKELSENIMDCDYVETREE